MSIKVLILGKTGMLGHMVSKVLSNEGTFTVDGTHLGDVNDPFFFDVESGLTKLDSICTQSSGYDYFINCIGITNNNVDENSSKSVLRAIKINVIFPHELAEFALKKDIRVIHISTDGVFSGKSEYYYEDSPHDCTDIYGKTKSLGEVINCGNFLNLRCSIMGPSPFEKGGLFEWFKSQQDGSVISGYTNHLWNGVTTLQFAELCKTVIKNNQFEVLRKESHVFHFAPNSTISKFELLNLLKTIFKKEITINPVEIESGIVKRILTSKYNGLKQLHSHDIKMEKPVMQLKEICNM